MTKALRVSNRLIIALMLVTIAMPLSAARLYNNIGFASGLTAVPCKSANEGSHYIIIDASSPTDCDSTGGGSTPADCVCRSGVYATDSSSASNSFQTIDAPSGTDPVADSSTDTLTLTCVAPLTCTGNSTTDTVAFDWSGQFSCSQLPALTGDVTSSAGSCATTVATVDPSTLSGLVVWLDASQDDANFNNGDAVGTATNYGSGGNFTQSTTAKKPTFTTGALNGLAAYKFDAGDCLVSSSTIGLSTFSAFVVFRATGHGFIYEQSAASDVSDGSSLYSDFAQARVRRTQISQRGTNPAGYGGDLNQWRVMAQEYNGTHETHRLWIDGAFVFIAGTSGAGPTASTSTITDTINVGCRNNGSFFLNGYIAEFMIYTPRLSSADADRVKKYLRYKYEL